MENKLLSYIKENLFLLITSLLTIILIVIVSIQYISFRRYEAVFAIRDNVKVENLSKYFKKLKGTYGDTKVYTIGTEDPNEPSILVLGGVHPNEPAGQMAATLLLEQLEVTRGTVYLLNEANKSAYTHSHPQEATPFYYNIGDTLWGGTRTFKYGSRATNAVDQWPISDVYVHSATGQRLSGTDTRNINRSFPGNKNGNFTELIATAIINLINEKNIILTLDLHEASPEYATNNAIVFHQKAEAVGIAGLLDFSWGSSDSRFTPPKQEYSPENLRGLTHREIGDNTDAIPFLAEASNITQGRIRGHVSSENIVSGKDKFYERATALGILHVDHSKSVSLHERTGRHVQTFIGLINAYNMAQSGLTNPEYIEKYQKGEFEINYNNMNFTNILDLGIGYFLRDPNNPNG